MTGVRVHEYSDRKWRTSFWTSRNCIRSNSRAVRFCSYAVKFECCAVNYLTGDRERERLPVPVPAEAFGVVGLAEREREREGDAEPDRERFRLARSSPLVAWGASDCAAGGDVERRRAVLTVAFLAPISCEWYMSATKEELLASSGFLSSRTRMNLGKRSEMPRLSSTCDQTAEI